MKKIKVLATSLILCFGVFVCCFATSCATESFVENNYKWWQKTNAYEVYVKSFKDTNNDGFGDLNGVTEKLDYIKSLNIGALWLTPVYKSPMVDNGYDIADYYNIDSIYGNMTDMENLISQAKDHDIKIIMDLVMNHTSDQNNWFKESCKGKDNKYSDFYIWRDAKPDGSAPNNWRSVFGGSAWTWNEQRGQYYLHTFASQQPDLNWESENVRAELQNVAKFWLDKGIGGFRVDACIYFKKPLDFSDREADGPDGLADIAKYTNTVDGIFDYLHEFKDKVCQGKDIFVVGEAFACKNEDLEKWVGKNGVFDMLFQFGHMAISGDYYKREYKSLDKLKKSISGTQEYTKDNGWCPIFFENHDSPRSINSFFPMDADAKLAAKAMGTLLFTLRGTPFLFQGEEIGMSNAEWTPEEFRDLESKSQYELSLNNGLTSSQALEKVKMFARDNGRTVMQWNSDKNAGFSNNEPWIKVNKNYKDNNNKDNSVNVSDEQGNSNSVLSYYKQLADYRVNSDILLYGDYEDLMYDNQDIFAFKRTYKGKSIVVLINFSNKDVEFDASNVENMHIALSNVDTNNDDAKLRPTEARMYVCN